MHISKNSATQIVEEISKLVKQNINLMDETGHIIASRDKSRIGDFHYGAYKIISENLEEYYIDEDDTSTLPLCFVEDSLYEKIAEKNDIDIPNDNKYYGLIQDEFLQVTTGDEGTKWSKEQLLKDGDEAYSLECRYIRNIPCLLYTSDAADD